MSLELNRFIKQSEILMTSYKSTKLTW